MNYSKGMTLVELMLALVIGLLIMAAAMQLFLTGSINYGLQKNLAELQDNGNFGLNFILKDIKLANLDADLAVVNDRNQYSGIVFTTIKSYTGLTEDEKKVATANIPYFISGDSANLTNFTQAKVGLSNVNVKSDQLVIQYKAFDPNGFDCEGNSISQDDIDKGTFIVQRYFLRQDGSAGNLALVCDAGRYKTLVETAALPTNISGLGERSQIIMRRVDYFHVLLGVKQNNTDEFSYMTIDQYMGATNSLTKTGVARPRIMSIQLGALVRGYDSISEKDKLPSSFTILDQVVTLGTSDADPKYIRDVISQTVALRNGYGLMEDL
ncbi:PilW family protein [Acinetobacter sp.]|jgi:type IV pilus assembly protein PilW|uniref:PilW family protein n=1 Tax=Acinetobacter sp. TaxID=472 RepID=UPI002827808A|nr:PilW family protein [Acinetobacter sp.]MDR0237946.1 PilW family protein [Acinetobacter sp.]